MNSTYVHDGRDATEGSQYKMTTLSKAESNLAQDPSTRSFSGQSSIGAVDSGYPVEGANIQELPPVDRGFHAWRFCAAAFALETLVWGFAYRFVTRDSTPNRH